MKPINNVPRVVLLLIEQSLLQKKQFEVVLVGTLTVYIMPFIAWWSLSLMEVLLTGPFILFAGSEGSFQKIYLDSVRQIVSTFQPLAVWGTVIFSFFYVALFLTISCIGYRQRANSLKSIMQMYFEAIFIFSLIFQYVALFSSSNGFGFVGFVYLGDGPTDWVSNWRLYLENIVNAIYFSATTLSGFNAGDIAPNGLVAKFFTGLESLYGTFLLVVVIGKFFSEKKSF